MNGNGLYRTIPHFALTVMYFAVFVYKVRHLYANRRNPVLWAMTTATFLSCMGCVVPAPGIKDWLYRLTGVANITQAPTAALLVASSASWLALALFWRYPADHAWRLLRWVLLVCAVDIILLVATFAAWEIPHNRQQGLSVNISYIPEQLPLFLHDMLFLIPVTLAQGTLGVWCLAWARESAHAAVPRLRRSLLLFGVACCSLSAAFLLLTASVVAAWSGNSSLQSMALAIAFTSLFLFTALFPAALLSVALGPLRRSMANWMERWRAYFALRSLHRALRPLDPSVVIVASGRRWDPRHRLRRTVIELNDWRWQLSLLFDPALAEETARWARETGQDEEQIEATVEAVQLKAAWEAWSRGARGRGATSEELTRDGVGIDAEITWWVRVARAFDERAGRIASSRTPTRSSTPSTPSTDETASSTPPLKELPGLGTQGARSRNGPLLGPTAHAESMSVMREEPHHRSPRPVTPPPGS